MKNKDNVDKNKDDFDKGHINIVSVSPIDKGLIKDELSYFSKTEPPIGSLVPISIRNRQLFGIVLRVDSAQNKKNFLREQSFSLKKLPSHDKKILFLKEFVETSFEMSDYFACPVGQIIKIFTPQAILELPEEKTIKQILEKEETKQTKSDKCILQEPDQERLTYYKSLIRESFAKKNSLFFCLPTVPDIDKTLPFLEKGIERYVIVLHGSLTKKEVLERWQKAVKSKHPVVIIATPLFLSIPRKDIKIMVVDKENSSAYYTNTKPFVDIRIFAERYATKRNIKIIFGDTVLRSETIFRQGKGELIPLSPLKYRSFSEAEQILIDLKQKTEESTPKELPILSPDFLNIIQDSIESNDRLFIFSDRRGTSSLTVCNDCGHVMSCEDCQSPLVVHKTQNKRYQFTCHKCNKGFSVRDTCDKCNSWRLSMYGSGIEKIESEILNNFEKVEIFSVDSDKVKTPKKAKEIVAKFLNSPGSILIGTEMALYYLKEPVENTAIGSIDSLFSLPDFRINEKIFATLVRTRELASNKFIIQTRNPEEKIFDYCLKGNLLDFYREEIADRKTYNYPPFTTLIKLSLIDTKEKAEAEMETVVKLLEAYQPSVYPALTSVIKNKYHLCCLIKLSPDKWPDDELLNILKNLPRNFIISIDPEQIL